MLSLLLMYCLFESPISYCFLHFLRRSYSSLLISPTRDRHVHVSCRRRRHVTTAIRQHVWQASTVSKGGGCMSPSLIADAIYSEHALKQLRNRAVWLITAALLDCVCPISATILQLNTKWTILFSLIEQNQTLVTSQDQNEPSDNILLCGNFCICKFGFLKPPV